ncbi:hypothetical protein [Streptomyces sp. V1I6]|uniref:hypothetical protein n=1 Tax=Streptomyces sp. V1I6 TaxID=3042273 RepID=UPI00278743D0|nr:hypothetical protein [Streptomyces sp. V1I6]MDQ0847405.1 hypothetical protein [Streptomyces sp. V1I6]
MRANAYSFLPWLRGGIATRISADPTGPITRAEIPVKLHLTAESLSGPPAERFVEQKVQLYGPGDIVGIDPRVVSRTEPRPWVTNAEPNYLAHIEFYDEDFPWQYSPLAPEADTGRLRPWLALVVLAGSKDSGEPGEFTEGAVAGRPLPFVTVTDPAATLPPPEQLGAWAHVHVDGELDVPIVSENMPTALSALRGVLDATPDRACSRLICPRHLLPNTGYHAFLVPAFETGRLAGLGFDPAAAPTAAHSAWGPDYPHRQAPGQLPYYHRWFFGTGSAGDFEYLVRLLQPGQADERVGRRDVDVQRPPGPKLPGITEPAALGGVLKLGGALRVPDRKQDLWDNWDGRFPTPPPPPPPLPPPPVPLPYPHPFQQALAGLVNLADDYLEHAPAVAHAKLTDATGSLDGITDGPEAADEVLPVVTPPLYGRWHARTSRLLTERDGTPIPAPENRNWVHRLNLDPRFRIAANFGTQVVQKRQEEFMAAAWAQVGEVIAANDRIRAAQLAREVGYVLHEKHLAPPNPPTDGAAAAPAPSGKALWLTAPAGSRVTAPVSAGSALPDTSPAAMVAVGFKVAGSRIAAAPVSPAMRRILRPASRLMRTLPFGADHPPPAALLPRMDDPASGIVAAAPKATPAAIVTPTELAAVLHPPGLRPDAPAGPEPDDPIGELPTSADFLISFPGDGVVPHPGGVDSPEAALFKIALKDLHQGFDTAVVGGRTDARDPLGVAPVSDRMLAELSADATVPRQLLSAVSLPERLRPFAERFIEAMAYPVVDLPMYRTLLDMSVDTFVPNLGLIPPNTITLLATDQEFIEAFMAGLNHEMARELLWREYPTDQRGTPFRQFWDPRAELPKPGETSDQRRERLYDITRMDTWTTATVLGGHDNRDLVQEEELVLVIRGELLKKYPTAAVYAHRAAWAKNDDGVVDPTLERVLAKVPDEERPSPHLVKLPIYEAKVEPDITLLGFDLTAAEARGNPPDDAGWFFVIKERPGDPRFGADDGPGTPVEVWNDLSWKDIDPLDRRFVTLDPGTQFPLVAFDGSEDDQEKREQRREDAALPLWHSRLSSADIAYMLFQAPVLIAVHAQEMLPDAQPAQ